ncbi:hypothetical protein AB5N19_10355 [Seiridium cardinale]
MATLIPRQLPKESAPDVLRLSSYETIHFQLSLHVMLKQSVAFLNLEHKNRFATLYNIISIRFIRTVEAYEYTVIAVMAFLSAFHTKRTTIFTASLNRMLRDNMTHTTRAVAHEGVSIYRLGVPGLGTVDDIPRERSTKDFGTILPSSSPKFWYTTVASAVPCQIGIRGYDPV